MNKKHDIKQAVNMDAFQNILFMWVSVRFEGFKMNLKGKSRPNT